MNKNILLAGEKLSLLHALFKVFIFLLFMVTFAFWSGKANAGDYYVATWGSSYNDGLTPLTPWGSISYALMSAESSEQDTAVIHVAPGTYNYSTDGIVGEFYPLILNARSYVYILGAGADSTTLHTNWREGVRAIKFSNCNHCKIDGFKITGGSGSGSFPDDVGGIIMIVNSSVTISNCKIVGNQAGGIWCSHSSPVIENNLIANNDVFDSGAGIRCDYSSAQIIDNKIKNNFAAGSGGGIFCYQSNPVIEGNTITNNSCQSIFYEGGGAAIACITSSPSIINNEIFDNIASAGSRNEGGGIYCTDDSNPIIGGALNKGNNIYDNLGSGRGNDLYRAGSGSIINAQYNYLKVPPSEVTVFPLDQFDLTNSIPPVVENHPPILQSFFPKNDTLLAPLDAIEFSVSAYDPDGDSLIYSWLLNRKMVSNQSTYKFIDKHTSQFIDSISVTVSDRQDSVTNTWRVKTFLDSLNFPVHLSVGNKFYYQIEQNSAAEGQKFFYRIEEVIDTEVINGKKYALIKVVTDDVGDTCNFYERCDFLRIFKYYPKSRFEYELCDFGCEVGDTLGEDLEVEKKWIDSSWGLSRWRMQVLDLFSYQLESLVIKEYMQTFGLVHSYFSDPWVAISRDIYLQKAIINGSVFTAVKSLPLEQKSNPLEYRLFQNFPNPFNSSTTIRFQIPKKSRVGLMIFDIKGHLVKSLINSDLEQAIHIIKWDGKDNSGRIVASGIYFCRIVTENYIKTRKLLLIR